MEKSSTGNTIKLHRVLKAPADRVYRAFIEPKAMVKWLPPYGFLAEVHQSDVREGGSYRMSFTNFRTGQSQFFGGKYLEIKPHQLLRYTDKFEDPNLPGEMLTIVSFREVSCGTELTVVQENIPSQIPAEMCYLGWQECLTQLALLVEPEIP